MDDALKNTYSTENPDTSNLNPWLKWGAHVVSAIFHPAFMAVYALLFVNYYHPYQFAHLPDGAKAQLFFTLVFNTIFFPMVTIFIMLRLEFIESIQMHTRSERIVPLIAISLFYFWCYLVVKDFGVGSYYTHIMLGGSLAVFATFFLNIFYKISMHAVGVGSLMAIALTLTMISNYDLTLPLLLIILCAGLVGSARLYLGAHIQSDVYSGYMIGILAQLTAFIFF